jgi:hypothetical protein
MSSCGTSLGRFEKVIFVFDICFIFLKTCEFYKVVLYLIYASFFLQVSFIKSCNLLLKSHCLKRKIHISNT